LAFNIKQLNLDWQKSSKTKVEKVIFFIFISSYAEINFWGPKKEKKSQNRARFFFFKCVGTGIKYSNSEFSCGTHLSNRDKPHLVWAEKEFSYKN
jgi:hypothetical protein